MAADDLHASKRALRNPKFQNELASSLRGLPESEVLKKVRDLLNDDEVAGLDLLVRVLRERTSFQLLLTDAMLRANSSTIRNWLEATMPRIGTRRTLDILEKAIPSNSDAVHGAFYWLPSYLSGSDRERLRKLREKLPLRKPVE